MIPMTTSIDELVIYYNTPENREHIIDVLYETCLDKDDEIYWLKKDVEKLEKEKENLENKIQDISAYVHDAMINGTTESDKDLMLKYILNTIGGEK